MDPQVQTSVKNLDKIATIHENLSKFRFIPQTLMRYNKD